MKANKLGFFDYGHNILPCGHSYIEIPNASYIKDIMEWIKKIQSKEWDTSETKTFTVRYPKI